jgi:hypothetical protein
MTNINNNINLFIENNAKRNEKLKLLKALDYIKENNIILEYKNEYNNNKHSITMIKNNIEIGHFQIDNLYTIPSMNILIEDIYHGNQLARLMITSILYVLCKYISSDLLLYIDTDASNGFWPSIGMKENKYYSTQIYKNRYNSGYELSITIKELSKWALDNTNIFI